MDTQLRSPTQPGAMRRAAALVGLTALAALLAVHVSWLDANAQAPIPQQVTAGEYHSCVLMSDGSVDCWGGNAYGQAADQAGPYVQIDAGNIHTCALDPAANVACWGYNDDRRHGRAGPFTQISSGPQHNCGVKANGDVDCWGNDIPANVGQSGPFTQVVVAGGHNCALKDNGPVHCWGVDNYGEARDYSANFTQITAGTYHDCGIWSDGTVECWGSDAWGQGSPRPGAYLQISAGYLFTCGIKTDHTLACWGYDFYGQVEDTPAGKFKQVAAGYGHVCAISEDDKIYCWGRNDHGQAIPPNLGGPAVTFDFEGFYPPVEPEPTLNAVKAGSAVPLKFSLGGDKGLNVIAAGYPASWPLVCATLDPSGDPQPTRSAGQSTLSYDAESGQYTYVWKTEKTWAGTCRVLALQLIDGTEHLLAFQFK